ncbi:MAG: DUF3365 domain-containing protein [Planctomycetaceae bacterium]
MRSLTVVANLMHGVLIIVAIAAFKSLIHADEPNSKAPGPPSSSKDVTLTVDEARRQAKTLHTTIHSTLRVMHDRYYREDEGLPVPAAAIGEILHDVETEEGVILRWLVVEGQAMNTDNVARNDFEKEAVAALKSGKPFHEESTTTQYRRAAPITLSNHCLKCHMPDRKSTNDRRAGLVVTIPLKRL